jgi:hypothetical protein
MVPDLSVTGLISHYTFSVTFLLKMNLAPSLHQEKECIECKGTERGATLQNHQPAAPSHKRTTQYTQPAQPAKVVLGGQIHQG